MRYETNRERAESLMAGLGRAARESGRIYFTGGVSAVHEIEPKLSRYPAIDPPAFHRRLIAACER